jgi:hypothetical protein
MSQFIAIASHNIHAAMHHPIHHPKDAVRLVTNAGAHAVVLVALSRGEL